MFTYFQTWIIGVVLMMVSSVLASDIDVTFLVTSDSHYDAFENEDRNQRNRITIEQMNMISGIRWPEKLGGEPIEKPRGVLLLGDVIDDGDRMREGKNQSEKQYHFFIADFGFDGKDGHLRYPVFEGWGNHDGPPVGRERYGFSFQSNLKQRNARRKQQGLIETISKNGLHYSWDWSGVHFIQINLYPGNQPHPKTRYSPKYHDPQHSLDFLKKDLAANAAAGGGPVVIMHHYDLQGTDWWHAEERRAYYKVLQPHNVIAVFHGHTGTGLYQWKPDGADKPLDVINTGQTENGFFVVQIKGDRIRLGYRYKSGITTTTTPAGKKERQWDGSWGWRWVQSRQFETKVCEPAAKE